MIRPEPFHSIRKSNGNDGKKLIWSGDNDYRSRKSFSDSILLLRWNPFIIYVHILKKVQYSFTKARLCTNNCASRLDLLDAPNTKYNIYFKLFI